jgi:hypothetical protein
MIETKPLPRCWVASVGIILAGLCMIFAPVFLPKAAAQNAPASGGTKQTKIAGDFDKIHAMPPGGPAPRMADGHPDLTGRWYPNSAGKMLQGAYPVDPAAMQQFDAKVTPEVAPSFKPGLSAEYTRAVDYGGCDQAGTPSVTMEQSIQHAPMELIATPKRLAVLYEYPLDVRMIYTGRAHPQDPDPTFNGDSTAHWEGNTLVVDVIAIDTRLRNIIGVGTGAGVQWFPSAKEHITERFSRPSKNYLIYQVTIDDPEVLAKPWTSAPRRWSLAPADDEWGEVFCTTNEEPEFWKKADPKTKQDFERQMKPPVPGQ